MTTVIVALVAATSACAPARSISPVGVAESNAATQPVFDEDQRARLEQLREALAEPPPASLSSGLLVRLAFDDAGDLDLFVTDPQQESVYFANSPIRSGGRLLEDRRCTDASPRVEAVHFDTPQPGRYRVGVDFHGRCRDSSLSGKAESQGLYFVRIDEGGRVLERAGMVTPGHFEVIVVEFDVD